MRRKVESEAVDRSRAGWLVHDARSSGRDLSITAYIEGLQGDSSRSFTEERLVCRSAEQAAAIAKLLRETRRAPDCSVNHGSSRTCEHGTRGCVIQHADFAKIEREAAIAHREAFFASLSPADRKMLDELAELLALIQRKADEGAIDPVAAAEEEIVAGLRAEAAGRPAIPWEPATDGRTCRRCGKVNPAPQEDCPASDEVPGGGTEPHDFRIVHVLLHGLPLCHFSRKVPGHWPSGHVWASFDAYRTGTEKVTCLACLACARLMTVMGPAPGTPVER